MKCIICGQNHSQNKMTKLSKPDNYICSSCMNAGHLEAAMLIVEHNQTLKEVQS